jgi:hypothetical protein
MHVEHIVSEDGDWVVIRVDGKEYYSGHSVPDFVWMTLLHTVSNHSITSSSKEISNEDMEEGNY